MICINIFNLVSWNGSSIPLRHDHWLKAWNYNQNSIGRAVSLSWVNKLIDHQSTQWNYALVYKLYEPLVEIMKLPLSRLELTTGWSVLKLYQGNSVKKNTYWLYHSLSSYNQFVMNEYMPIIWNSNWKLNMPFKVITFFWKLLNNSVPVRKHGKKTSYWCNLPLLFQGRANTWSLFYFLWCCACSIVWLPIKN